MNTAPGNLAEVVDRAVNVIALFIPIAAALAILLFIWGLVKFIAGAGQGSEANIKNGKDLMLWGTIALFVTFSMWGLSRFVSGVFFTGENNTTPPVPTLPTIGGG